jgi:hypothetical protein
MAASGGKGDESWKEVITVGTCLSVKRAGADNGGSAWGLGTVLEVSPPGTGRSQSLWSWMMHSE